MFEKRRNKIERITVSALNLSLWFRIILSMDPRTDPSLVQLNTLNWSVTVWSFVDPWTWVDYENACLFFRSFSILDDFSLHNLWLHHDSNPRSSSTPFYYHVTIFHNYDPWRGFQGFWFGDRLGLSDNLKTSLSIMICIMIHS